MNPMKLMIDAEQSRSLKQAERATGKTKEEILQVCLSTHLLKELGSSRLAKELGSSRLAAFLRANDLVEVEPDTILN
jgi:hypothetical protein